MLPWLFSLFQASHASVGEHRRAGVPGGGGRARYVAGRDGGAWVRFAIRKVLEYQ